MHRPVLLNEVLEIFDPQPGQSYIDATVNGGGHALAILERVGPKGKLLGIDRDCKLITTLETKSRESEIKNITLVCDNYANIGNLARSYNMAPVDGILFDLGVSSHHFEDSERGFSFLKNEPLDMRFDPKSTSLTAWTIVNQWPEEQIESILRQYGEERFSRRIARETVRARKRGLVQTTYDLVAVIRRAVPRRYCRGRLHCATRTFQALRIAVNDELSFLENALNSAIDLLGWGGKLAAISFHSLEDTIVKKIFQEAVQAGVAVKITKKVIRPDFREVRENPRARSAKLRGIQKNN
ncbi:MAG: 16S rRNA (cytosine(1402)-N(4))-methyltransferase RsmH [Candidatus Sungbacteria bacterium]|nr:16S rRNA (cytosine(1402)-N(4))-methyltransferase RsmH [Candidatus Sungbacteria bacterium]